MSLNEITKPRNVGLGAAAGPLLIVGAVVLINGASDPNSSVADVQAPPNPETIIRPPMGNLTEAQSAAIRFRDVIPVLSESDSPFPQYDEDPSDFSDDPDLEPLSIDSDLMVTAMIASNAGNIALINGKARRERDELDGGWVIKEIDVRAKLVVLKNGQGKVMTLSLNRPGSQQTPKH